MSLIPGIAGQATVLVDGVKVDSILENTLNNGVQIKGRTNGVAVSAGYVGEIIESTAATGVYQSGSAFYFNVTGAPKVTLTAGVWLLSGSTLMGSAGSAYQASVCFKSPSAPSELIGLSICDITGLYQIGVTPVGVTNFTGASRDYYFYYQVYGGGNGSAGYGSATSGRIIAIRIA